MDKIILKFDNINNKFEKKSIKRFVASIFLKNSNYNNNTVDFYYFINFKEIILILKKYYYFFNIF